MSLSQPLCPPSLVSALCNFIERMGSQRYIHVFNTTLLCYDICFALKCFKKQRESAAPNHFITTVVQIISLVFEKNSESGAVPLLEEGIPRCTIIICMEM